MNWFNILKNEIASTKGKTFQLDFNQPMIEDKDCRDEFTQLTKKASELSFGIVEASGKSKDNVYYKVFNNGIRYVKSVPYIPIITEYAFPTEPVPEEVYCRALELYKTKEKFHDEMFNGYYIRVGLSIYRTTEYTDGKKTGKMYDRTYRKHCMIMKGQFEDGNYAHGFIFDMDAFPITHRKYPEAIDEFFKKVDSL